MDDKKITKRHLNTTTLEEHFTQALEDNSEYLKAVEGVDLGAGGGRFSKILSKYVKNLYSVDVSEEAITAMNTNLADFKNIKIIKVQSNSLPFKDSSIDMVFAANSFHDVPVGYESEIRRVLNTNGLFVNLDWKKEPTTFGPPLSIRFSEDDVVSKLKKQHFKLIKKQDIKTHYMLIFSKI